MTPATRTAPGLAVIPGAQVAEAPRRARSGSRTTSSRRPTGSTTPGPRVNPPSYFLRFPTAGRPDHRASRVDRWDSARRRGEVDLQRPGQRSPGLPRASGVLVLNDHDTGYLRLPGGVGDQRRTNRGNGGLEPRLVDPGRARPKRVGFFGAGLIARYVPLPAATGWQFEAVGVHDTSAESAAGFRTYLERIRRVGTTTVHEGAEGSDPGTATWSCSRPSRRAARDRPLVVRPPPRRLRVSLRDLAPEVLLRRPTWSTTSTTASRAETSPHLAERRTGSRDFLLARSPT